MTREILQDIIDDFSLDKFVKFFRAKNRRFSPKKEKLIPHNLDNFRGAIKLGEIEFSKTERFVICAFEVSQSLSERSGKRLQYEEGKRILKDRQFDAGIFIFYDKAANFRFSLIYANYLGKRRDWSAFRRFTYFVSRGLTNKTFRVRMGDSDFSMLKKIKEAFSVEPVTNRFFEEFRLYFEKTKKEFEKSNETICLWLKDRYSIEEYNEQINKFSYTFLGRIIFIYFLQRKGWIENEANYLRKLVEKKENLLLYFRFFQPLFFDVFAKKESERSGAIKRQYKNTPYLNGGLFEKSDIETQLAEQGKFILFKDIFIRDLILNFFENYNFTIDENSLEDQEISIDPEMLGKVFENTLAEEERGKKGTFYTPREIVHFMVKESLYRFLQNETKFDKQKLYQFVFDIKPLEEIGFRKEDVRLIDYKLEHIKVLDPAVGSAAFPVEMMQVLVHLRKQLNVNVGKNVNEVLLKKQFIKENLYGVDIDPGAIEIAKLRLWLSLIVDYEKSEAEPLPNLDFQFRLGNSLQEKINGINIFCEFNSNNGQQVLLSEESEFEKVKQEMISLKDKFYVSENEKEKKNLKNNFDKFEHELILAVSKKYRGDLIKQLKNSVASGAAKRIAEISEKIKILEQKIQDGTYKLFKPDFHFSEVFDRKDEDGKRIGGFDIVIGNPPYGVRVEDDIKEWHKLGSKDSYGVFISTALKRFLKPGGVLSYIVSDTWLTIKTHRYLRKQVLSKRLHRIVRVHQDCFEATVNACIMSLTNSPDNNGKLIVADLSNISTRKEIEEMRNKLYCLSDFVDQSNIKFGVYEYNQDLIKINSNLPIFIGDPKLFILMNDTTCRTIDKKIGGKKVKVRQIKLNNKMVELVRLGDVAEIRQGLATGDNHSYLYQNPQTRGTYRSIEEYKKYLLTERDLKKIVKNEALRSKVISRGFHKVQNEKNFDEDLWFDGRYIIPYDKGGESDTETGWLPNYYVPTNYFIDWSCAAVKRMKTLTIKQRDGKGESRICSRFQNSEYYFKYGITFSWAGVYCPTFRKSSIIFDHGSSDIFTTGFNADQLLGISCSKLTKLFSRIYINHSINFGIDDVKEIPINLSENQRILDLLIIIFEKQKQNPRYDYMSNEQKEIDKLVYEMYGLNKDDIREVEIWYARRYPKLARFCEIPRI